MEAAPPHDSSNFGVCTDEVLVLILSKLLNRNPATAVRLCRAHPRAHHLTFTYASIIARQAWDIEFPVDIPNPKAELDRLWRCSAYQREGNLRNNSVRKQDTDLTLIETFYRSHHITTDLENRVYHLIMPILPTADIVPPIKIDVNSVIYQASLDGQYYLYKNCRTKYFEVSKICTNPVNGSPAIIAGFAEVGLARICEVGTPGAILAVMHDDLWVLDGTHVGTPAVHEAYLKAIPLQPRLRRPDSEREQYVMGVGLSLVSKKNLSPAVLESFEVDNPHNPEELKNAGNPWVYNIFITYNGQMVYSAISRIPPQGSMVPTITVTGQGISAAVNLHGHGFLYDLKAHIDKYANGYDEAVGDKTQDLLYTPNYQKPPPMPFVPKALSQVFYANRLLCYPAFAKQMEQIEPSYRNMFQDAVPFMRIIHMGDVLMRCKDRKWAKRILDIVLSWPETAQFLSEDSDVDIEDPKEFGANLVYLGSKHSLVTIINGYLQFYSKMEVPVPFDLPPKLDRAFNLVCLMMYAPSEYWEIATAILDADDWASVRILGRTFDAQQRYRSLGAVITASTPHYFPYILSSIIALFALESFPSYDSTTKELDRYCSIMMRRQTKSVALRTAIVEFIELAFTHIPFALLPRPTSRVTLEQLFYICVHGIFDLRKAIQAEHDSESIRLLLTKEMELDPELTANKASIWLFFQLNDTATGHNHGGEQSGFYSKMKKAISFGIWN